MSLHESGLHPTSVPDSWYIKSGVILPHVREEFTEVQKVYNPRPFRFFFFRCILRRKASSS